MKRRRSLSQSGGPARLSGDPERARLLAHALHVQAPGDDLPFTHGFHAYPARMHPETARRVLEAFPADRVLDPFVGSGTTAVEAVRRGARFTGLDVSRMAIEIAWTRTRVARPEECRRVEAAGKRISPGSRDLPVDVPAGERGWYEPHTLREICAMKALVDHEEPALRRSLTCVLSSILVKLSRQVSDSVVKIDAGRRPPPRGAAPRMFVEKCTELTGNLLRLSSDLHKRGIPFVEPDLRLADARTAALEGRFDLVLTSPPYEGTYDYASHQERRRLLYGADAPFAERHEIGSRRDPSGYRAHLQSCLKNVMAHADRMVVLIGDGHIMRGERLMADLAAGLGARVTAGASVQRRDWSGGPPRGEHLLLVEKVQASS